MHTRELGLTREGVRDGFARAIGTYDGLTNNDFFQLGHMVGVELCRRNRRIAGGRAKGTQMLPSTVNVVCEGDRLTAAHICVDCVLHGDVFARREAITLNPNCYLEIAEWADERDVQPFLRAIDAWVDEVRDELYWQRTHAGKGGGGDE